VARAAQQLSNFYIEHPGQPTPWNEPYARPGYLGYFLPLNVVRLRSVWNRIASIMGSVQEVWDWGSGLGTLHWILEHDAAPASGQHLNLFCVEHSRVAVDLHKHLMDCGESPLRLQPSFNEVKRRPSRGALGVFSYSLLEMNLQPSALEEFDHLLIVEPSTRERGRNLMSLRQDLLGLGYQPLAPCTHAQVCPLLEHSSRDWCHFRMGFQAPDWWQQIESHLPMKNSTLTYSYLLASRTWTRANNDSWRVIGDRLDERGKSRQLVCRDNQRVFLSWLHRHGAPPDLPSGALLTAPVEGAQAGNEWRVDPGADLRWT